MNIYVLFGQRKEHYNGEYGLEALAVASESDEDSNPEYMQEQLTKYRESDEFSSLAIITLKAKEGDIRRCLTPSNIVEAQVSSLPADQL